MVILQFLLCLALALLSSARSTTGPRLLAIVDEASDKAKYSKFWGDLEDRGFRISFETPKSERLSLFKHGERSYDHLILLPAKAKGLGPALTPKLLLQFINQDGNIMLALGSESAVPSTISSLLLELDIQLPLDRSSIVVDHFNHDTSAASEKHDVLLLPCPSSKRPGVRSFFDGQGTIIFPRPIAQELGNSSPLLAPILNAKSTAYTYNPKEDTDSPEDLFAVGEQIALVSTMQARNSARFTVFGSVEALEDQWFDAKVNGPTSNKVNANREFAKRVSAWTFQEIGVLQVNNVEHHLSTPEKNASSHDLVSQTDMNPKIYRIKNDVTFNVELSEYVMDHYEPLGIVAPDSVQLEFTMLSPFHRIDLVPVTQTTNSTIFSTTFRLPDQHGIFRFQVDYKRPFLTNVDVKREVTVRHFAHDEWPRSWEISAGWVWIAGIWVTIFGWIAFVAIWIYSEPTKEGKPGKKDQ